jgi:hypothetical protein
MQCIKPAAPAVGIPSGNVPLWCTDRTYGLAVLAKCVRSKQSSLEEHALRLRNQWFGVLSMKTPGASLIVNFG